MGRVAEVNLVGMDADPARAQSSREVSAEPGCEQLNRDEPGSRQDSKSRHRDVVVRPRRDRDEAEARSKRDKSDRKRRGDEGSGDDSRPGNGGILGLPRLETFYKTIELRQTFSQLRSDTHNVSERLRQ